MSRRRSIGIGLAAITAGASMAAAPAAAATPAPFGSPALYHWLVGTAAQALQAAAERDSDLRQGGLLALNRGVKSSLDQVDAFVPDWIAELDLRFALREDLTALYGMSASRPLYEADGRAFSIEAFGRVDFDQAGKRSGEFGVGVGTEVRDDRFEIDLAGGLDQEWLRRRERHTARLRIEWWRLTFTGSAFDETTMDEPSGALYEERLLDGFDLALETGVPFLPWLSVGTRQLYLAPTAPQAAGWRSARYSLKACPVEGLEIETGAETAGANATVWFASLRYQVKFGPR